MSLIWQNISGTIWVIKKGIRVKQKQMTLDDYSKQQLLIYKCYLCIG